MHRIDDDDSSKSLRPLGICLRLYKFVVAKLWRLGQKVFNEDKPEKNELIKKRLTTGCGIPIRFKQTEDSEDNGKSKKNSPRSSSQESEGETMIILANGSNGQKNKFLEKGKKSRLGEPSLKQQITHPEAGQPPQPHIRLRPILNDINNKSDAFIEKMRKRLAKTNHIEPTSFLLLY